MSRCSWAFTVSLAARHVAEEISVKILLSGRFRVNRRIALNWACSEALYPHVTFGVICRVAAYLAARRPQGLLSFRIEEPGFYIFILGGARDAPIRQRSCQGTVCAAYSSRTWNRKCVPAMIRALIAAACLVIILAGIKVSASLVAPFLFAVFLAILLTPPYLRLKQFGLPAAVVLTVMILGLALFGFVTVTILKTSLDQFAINLPGYEAALRDKIEGMLRWLDELGIDIPSSAITDNFNPQFVMRYAGQMARALSGLLGQAFVILLIAAFMLVEASGLQDKLRRQAGISPEKRAALEANFQDVRRYVSLKSAMSLLTGGLVTAWLWMFGVDNIIFMGLLAFFLNFIPTIGSFIAAIPGVLLAFIQFGPMPALVVAAGYVVINVGVSNVIEPRFMGERLGISPLVVVLSLLFWGWLLGPIGMLLSVPLTMVIKVFLESADQTKSIAIFLGPSQDS